jgi:cytochrome c553
MGNNNSTPVTPQTIYKAASANNVQLLIVSFAACKAAHCAFVWRLHAKLLFALSYGPTFTAEALAGPVLQEVLTKVPSNQLYQFLEPQDECGWTPLMVASAKGHTAAAHEASAVLCCCQSCHKADIKRVYKTVTKHVQLFPCWCAATEGRCASPSCQQRGSQHSIA